MSHFDKIVVLNVPSATLRWEQTVQELLRVGISGYQQFAAIPASNPRESFNLSMIAIIKQFVKSGRSSLLILEDDVVFSRHPELVRNRLDNAVSQLPNDWDILYLGCNQYVDGFRLPTRYSKYLCRVYNAWTTHAIAFSRKAAKWVLEQQPPVTEGMFDGWLSSKLPYLNAFCIAPMVAFQRAGESIIWGHKVNYNDIFLQTNHILTQA